MKQINHMKKKTIIMLMVLMPFISMAQMTSSLGYGYDLNGRAMAKWSVGYTAFQIVELEGEIRPSISRNIFAHNYVGFRGGIHAVNPDESGLFLIIGAGYYYDMRSQDKKSWNKDYLGTFVKGGTMLNENGGLFLEGLFINNSAQFCLGIHYCFTNRERLY